MSSKILPAAGMAIGAVTVLAGAVSLLGDTTHAFNAASGILHSGAPLIGYIFGAVAGTHLACETVIGPAFDKMNGYMLSFGAVAAFGLALVGGEGGQSFTRYIVGDAQNVQSVAPAAPVLRV